MPVDKDSINTGPMYYSYRSDSTEHFIEREHGAVTTEC
jgi:hypothetical protein